MKQKYYSLKNILEYNATYNMIIGERSNGKTYAALLYGLEEYARSGGQMALIRRWQDDFRGKRGAVMFDGLIANGVISRITEGEWTDTYYYGGKWYFCRYEGEDKKLIKSTEPFCFAFALSSMEHDKSTSYPKVTTLIFDEFLSRGAYHPDEFILFMNTVSTIARDRTNIKIFMLGNTVNQYCPYFKEMGLSNVKNQKQGTIDLYHYGNSSLTVAVEYCAPTKAGKASDTLFAFDNPKLQMITGGAWELDIYPHRPVKFAPKDIIYYFFIEFGGELLQCEIVNIDGTIFTYIHRKTTELKNPDKDLIYSPEHNPRPNWKRKITKPASPLEKRIYKFFFTEKVFYQDNEVGEIVRNYILWCKSEG